MKWIIVAVAVAALSGCAAVKNISADDIRNEKHLRLSGEIPSDMKGVAQSMYKYETTCRPLGRLDVDPADSRSAVFMMSMPGWSQPSAAVVIDMRESEGVTKYRGYTYYETWNKHLKRALYALGGGTDCSQ
ncbi:MAG TPA: hypothetical protein VNQ97_13755 [Burkholderiaceae bacterium]|nr:hypothetical protein [Burkholderiaceae bacterium]